MKQTHLASNEFVNSPILHDRFSAFLAAYGFYLVVAHDSLYAVLATFLASPALTSKYALLTINATTGHIRITYQAQ